MFRSRFWMLVAVLTLTVTPLLGTAGYGLYLRSSLYAGRVAGRVAAFLGTTVQIGSVVPLDRATRGFRDIAVWLPGEFAPVFSCNQATLQTAGGTLELELCDGRLQADTDTWNQDTLATLLRTAFGHDFQLARVASVKLVNMDLSIRRGQMLLQARGLAGRIDLSGKTGRLDILCDSLNGRSAAQPLAISCCFVPGNPPLIEQLSLSVSRLPIEALLPPSRKNLSPAQPLRPEPAAGWISGKIVYRQKDRGSLSGHVTLSGDIFQVNLGAVSEQLSRKHLAGEVSGSVTNLVLDAGHLTSAEGRLHAENLQTGGLLALAGFPQAEGSLTLDIAEARYQDGQLKALLATAQLRDVDLAPLLRGSYGGAITGRLSADFEKVRFIDGRLDELAGNVRMTPPAEGGTIDRVILTTAAHQLLGIDLPPVLPETIGYTDLGAVLHGADNQLYVEGVAGPDQKYLLVVDVPPAPMPLIAQPTEPLSLDPLQTMLIDRFSAVRTWLADWLRTSLASPN